MTLNERECTAVGRCGTVGVQPRGSTKEWIGLRTHRPWARRVIVAAVAFGAVALGGIAVGWGQHHAPAQAGGGGGGIGGTGAPILAGPVGSGGTGLTH
ncbi:hypothetical protein [Krasilnikovia sp. M28-CT-15]|uniref:hypothetical protein n=1 Tax=Krasilnikovia sp. M28-CT-15 TaxID=3373540 RepID=UPI0038775D73